MEILEAKIDALVTMVSTMATKKDLSDLGADMTSAHKNIEELALATARGFTEASNDITTAYSGLKMELKAIRAEIDDLARSCADEFTEIRKELAGALTPH